MKFYLFLSNLLFGITLLTFAVAASHSLGVIIIGKVGQTPSRIRKQLRYFILFWCISISLFLFFDRLIGFWSKSIRFHADLSMQEQLFPRHLGGREAEAVILPHEEANLDQSMTLFSPIVTEDLGTLSQMKEFAKAKLHLRFYSQAKGEFRECNDWIQTLKGLGIQIDRTSQLLERSKNSTPLLICLGETLKEDDLKSIKQWVYDGGTMILFGRPVPGASAALNPVLGIESWQDADHSGATSFIFGGPRLSGGSFGHRNRVVLGSDWLNHPGLPLVEMKEGVAGAYLTRMKGPKDSSEVLTPYSPLVFSEFGKGRAFWTSLPPRLYSKLDLIYTPLWNEWLTRGLAFVFELPVVTLDPWKNEGKYPGAVAVHAEYQISNLKNLMPTLKELNAHASAYFVVSEAKFEKNVVKDWEAAGNETGVSFLSHSPPLSNEYFDIYNEYEEMSRWGKFPSGAMIFPGVNASTDLLAATMALGYRYVLGDTFSDQFTPYSMTAGKTQEMLRGFPQRAAVLAPVGPVQETIFPTPLGDEFQWHYSNKFEVQSILKGMIQYHRWASAPPVIKIHSQSLAHAEVLEGLTEEMKNASSSTQWKTVGELVDRWEESSKVQILVEWSDPKKCKVKVTNGGNQAIHDATLRVLGSRRWNVPGGVAVDDSISSPMLVGGSKARAVVVQEFTVLRLEAGETKEYEFTQVHED